jgi:hypothetical protein
LLGAADQGIREQAFGIVRNFADSEEDIDVVFLELGSDRLLDIIASGLQSKNSDVLLQVYPFLRRLSYITLTV